MEPAQSSLLVVDDNEMNRDMLARRLARRGYTVAVAADGQQALQMLEAQSFDLILLDIMMPGISGYDVLVLLKRDPRFRDIPVIMISALSELDSVVRCIEAGCNDYDSKPIEFPRLLGKIEALLQ